MHGTTCSSVNRFEGCYGMQQNVRGSFGATEPCGVPPPVTGQVPPLGGEVTAAVLPYTPGLPERFAHWPATNAMSSFEQTFKAGSEKRWMVIWQLPPVAAPQLQAVQLRESLKSV